MAVWRTSAANPSPSFNQLRGGQGGLCEGAARAPEAFGDPVVPGPEGQAFIVGNQISSADLLLNHQVSAPAAWTPPGCLDSSPLLSA
ncbi:hypothetical protein PAL_GLEAN10015249 [Pteropus alecto]|uniref:Uncharacterized protein n=1 Tax=Pteropus alecto TaxID=9402 RepID=L5KHP1_PTEAL|nr:hypothetical protein PAL_GLEAN10015249 [Pteropus alecto]